MRRPFTKDNTRIKRKKIVKRVKENVSKATIDKAITHPYYLSLHNKNHVVAVYYHETKRYYKLFTYEEHGCQKAIELAMSWLDENDKDRKTHLGSISETSAPALHDTRTVFRVCVSYYDSREEKWRTKSFSITSVLLTDVMHTHLRKTAEAWLASYIASANMDGFTNWRNKQMYGDGNYFDWRKERDKCM